MTRLIAFVNRKGGSGKTTTAVHVSAGLADLDCRVLLVDVDPQAHASLWFGLSCREKLDQGLYRLLQGKENSPLSLVKKTGVNNLDLLPGGFGLTEYEAENSHKRGAVYDLARLIAPFFNHYDYLVFDTPPTVGLLMVSVLTATRWIIIPLPMQFLAMEGLAEMVRLLYKINASGNKGLRLKGIIPVMHDKRLKISANIKKEIIKVFGDKILLPAIRPTVKLAEAPSFQQTIFDYAPACTAALDYRRLVKKIKELNGTGENSGDRGK